MPTYNNALTNQPANRLAYPGGLAKRGGSLDSFVPLDYSRLAAGQFRQDTPQMREYAANVPVDVMRGRLAGMLGFPSDVLNMFRTPSPMEMFGQTDYEQPTQVPYGSEQFLKTLPLAPAENNPLGRVANRAGSLVPFTPMEALQAARMARQAAMATGKFVAPKAAQLTEGYMQRMGMMPSIVPKSSNAGLSLFDDATKYHQKVPEINSINIDKLKRMNAGEVADVSDEVAANMDFSKPIQVSVFSDGELRIVDGHHRVAAAKRLGMTSLPVELQSINARGSTLNKLAQESNYPQQAAKNINVALNESSNFLSAKSEFGQVGGTIRPPDKFSDKPYLQINYAEVEKASRGLGKGKELYQSLIDEAQARGLRVFSDSTVEKQAVNVYKSLGKKDYELRDMTSGSLEDGAVYGVGAKNPAFEILPRTNNLAPQ